MIMRNTPMNAYYSALRDPERRINRGVPDAVVAVGAVAASAVFYWVVFTAFTFKG